MNIEENMNIENTQNLGFKATNKDMCCINKQYILGETYKYEGTIEMCKNGFHFCEKLYNVFKYYKLNNNYRYFIIKYGGNNISDYINGNKSVTNEITFLYELLKFDKEVYNKHKKLYDQNLDALLILFVSRGDLSSAKFLADKGADIRFSDDFAVRCASYNGHLDVVKFLVDKGADISSYYDEAVRLARQNGHLNMVKYLVDKEANDDV